MSNVERLVVGLGNPGDDYDHTRHNIGFMAVEALADSCRHLGWKKRFQGLLASSDQQDLLFLKPMTYMNLSGQSVAEALRFYKLAPEQVVVFHDDLDLPSGQVRIKQGGGHGGHNGLKSLDAHIGRDYWRVRMGIGHPGERGDAVTNYVLGRFAKADRAWLDLQLAAVARDFDLFCNGKTAEYAAKLTVVAAANINKTPL